MDRTDLARSIDTAARALSSAARLLSQAAQHTRAGRLHQAEKDMNEALEAWDHANTELFESEVAA